MERQEVRNYQAIVALLDDFTEADMQLLNAMPREIELAAYGPSRKLAKFFFIEHYPYLIAVSKHGEIVGINRSMWQATKADTFKPTNGVSATATSAGE